MVNWTTTESFTRLLAAIYAAHPGIKFNYNEIAHMYGEGATYDAIEGRFRKIKKEAANLREAADSGAHGPMPVRGGGGGGSQNSSPKKKRAPAATGVLDGRVAKASPGGRGRKKIVKKEIIETSDESGSFIDGSGEDGLVDWNGGAVDGDAIMNGEYDDES